MVNRIKSALSNYQDDATTVGRFATGTAVIVSSALVLRRLFTH
jgi:hypothetical protein